MIAQETFGRSGHRSSRVLLGAAAFWDVTQDEADAALDAAFTSGVNHVDTAASYGNAELRIGSWIVRHGRDFFLATKTEQRTAPAAYEEIRRSLDRLRVDQVDLIQLHNLIDPTEWETALGPGGALEAAIRARDEGLVRWIGVTGHGRAAPARHTAALQRFDFDSVLLPWNYMMAQDAVYRADFERLLALCRERNVAVQCIKSLLRSPWGAHPQDRNTWYRPLEDQADLDLAVHWLLGQPGLFLNSAGDVNVLPRVLDAAARFTTAPDDTAMQAMVDRLEMQTLFP